jgi:hypothetical protein
MYQTQKEKKSEFLEAVLKQANWFMFFLQKRFNLISIK